MTIMKNQRKIAVQVCTLLLTCLVVATSAWGQLGINTPDGPFDMIGFIEDAKLACQSAAPPGMCGGTITVHNITVTVPDYTILQMPATGLSWSELFSMNPMAIPGETGLAMRDTTPVVDPSGTAMLPLGFRPTYEVHVQGNIVSSKYIAGLIFISQQALNSGQGYIDNIVYPAGGATEIRVANGLGNGTGTIRIKINTPNARYGPAFSPDPRFTSDEDNPTIAAESGYPVCLPRFDPATAPDPLCPQFMRPLDPAQPGGTAKAVTYPPTLLGTPPALNPSSNMAPLETGDYITWAGNLYYDATGPYIAAHTIQANLGLYTSPGSDPVYVQEQDILQGAGVVANPNIPLEGTARLVMVGFTTDATRTVTVGGVDVDCNGVESFRPFVPNFIPDPGPPNGAKLGRIVIRLLGGPFLPPAHYIRTQVDGATHPITNNGLVAGVYTAPEFDFIFAEAINLGAPPPLLNLQDLVFLVNGEGPWRGDVTNPVRQLSPWPGSGPAPTAACIFTPPPPPPPPPSAPTASAVANPATATSGTGVTLDGSASTGGTSFSWAQAAGDLVQVSITNASAAVASFVAPAVSSQTILTFTLTVNNATGPAATASVSVTINAPVVTLPPVANAGPDQTVNSGALVTLDGSASSDPQGLLLSFAWTQTSGPAVVQTTPNLATTSFLAPLIAPGQPNATLTFQLTVTNSATLSASDSVTITVKPLADTVTISTPVRYRVNKARLDVVATTNLVSPNVTLTCVLDVVNPVTGQPFSSLMTNAGGGTYNVTMLGIPQPHLITVNSSAGGTSSTTNIQLR